MKILHINKFLFKMSGSEQYMFQLASLQKRHGNQIMFFSMKDKKNIPCAQEKYFVSDVETEDIGWSLKKLKSISRMFYSQEAQKNLTELIKNERPDIAHLHNIYHQISPSILPLLKKQGIPVVYTVHDYKLICPNYILYTKGAFCTRCQKHKYYQAVINKCLKDSYLASGLSAVEMYFHKMLRIYEKNVDVFIIPSQFEADIMAEFGIDQKKMRVVSHFMEIDKIEPKFGAGAGYFLYIGRHKHEKGLDILIKAMQYLPWARLKVIGTGPAAVEYQKLARNLALKNVEFLGWVEDQELPKLFQNARSVVVPSRFAETFGLSAAEGLAYGKPVIAAAVGALSEMVIEQKTGLLFKNEDEKELARKMQFIINHPLPAEQMGRAGRELVAKKFQPEDHYKKIMHIYQQVGENKF